jgi:hypothetical protein
MATDGKGESMQSTWVCLLWCTLTGSPEVQPSPESPEVIVIPLFGGITNRDAEARMRNSDEWEFSRRVRFADERWFCDTQLNELGGISLSLKLYRDASNTFWEGDEYVNVDLREGDVFPLLDHLYRYENHPSDQRLAFRDVTALAPREIVPVRGEVTVLNNSYRLCVRTQRLANLDRRQVGVSVETDGPTGAKAWVHTHGRSVLPAPRDAGRLVKTGDVLNIAEGTVLKVVRTVPPRQIAGVGRLIGWVCFEDPLNAAELAKNAEFHKKRRERERNEPHPVFP